MCDEIARIGDLGRLSDRLAACALLKAARAEAIVLLQPQQTGSRFTRSAQRIVPVLSLQQLVNEARSSVVAQDALSSGVRLAASTQTTSLSQVCTR